MYYKLEKKFGRYAIPGLMRYVLVLYIIGFISNMINPQFYYQYLMLDIDKLLHGQIWRIFTFVIQPMEGSVLMMLLMCYVYYSIGINLEKLWGTFRFNLYYISGILFNALAVVIVYLITKLFFGLGMSFPVSLDYLNLSMLLAFAATFPEMQFYLMFLIPIKAKILLWGYAALMAYEVIASFINGTLNGIITTVMIICSFANFLIFFFSARKHLSPKNIARRMKFRADYNRGAAGAASSSNDTIVTAFRKPSTITRHKCAVCGKTEVSDPDMEFRFCSKCNGNYEYCSEHLFTHKHFE